MISEDTRRWVLQRDQYTCRFCGHSGNSAILEVDHSVPVAQGATDHSNNLQAVCWVCNALKSDRNTRSFESWLRYNFASRAHYARLTACARASGRILDLERWLSTNPSTLSERFFSDWNVPGAHSDRWASSIW